MAAKKTTSKTVRTSNTKVTKTKFVRLKRDQQLKDEFGSVFTEVYYGLKKACSTGGNATATDLFIALDRKVKRKDIAVILEGASWSKKVKDGHYTFFDKILEDRRKKNMDASKKAVEKEFFTWLSISFSSTQAEQIRTSFPTVSTILVQRKALKAPLAECSKIGQVENALRQVKQFFANKKFRNSAITVLTAYLAFLRDRKQEGVAKVESFADDVPSSWIRFDFKNAGQFSRTRPVKCLVGGCEIVEKNWARVFVAVLENEIQKGNPALKDLQKQSLMGKREGNPFFLKKAIEGLHCAQLSNGYWININYSIPQLMEQIRELCFRCGYSKEQILLYGEKKSVSEERNASGTKTHKLAADRSAPRPEVVEVLQRHYPYGYRIESSIEMNRLRKFAEIDGLVLPDNDEQLKAEVANAGILIEDKIYVINNETITGLHRIVQTIKEDGPQCFFFASLFDHHQEWADENHITSVEILREIFVRNQDKVLDEGSESYIAKNFVSFKGKCTEKDAVTDEMRRVWGSNSVSYVEYLNTSLPYVPEEYIRRYLSGNRSFAWVAEEQYLLVDRLVISKSEEVAIYKFVADGCEAAGFASIADIPLGNIVEENYELTTAGLHTAIYNRVLFDDFYLNGKILTKEKNGLNVVSLVKQFIANKDECTFEEAHSKVAELTGGQYRYMAYEALYDSMVRVDESRYVHEKHVRFDVDAIDEALSDIVSDGFIAIKEVTTFALFPTCGQAWNHYLLESFCYRYSKKYALHVVGFNDKNAGIIAERRITCTYEEFLAKAAARAKIELEPAVIGTYFFETGYMGKRKFAWLDSVTEKAIAIREEQ